MPQVLTLERRGKPRLLLHRFITRRLLLGMLVVVDALADPVLLTIDPFLLGLGEMAVVLRHVLLLAVLHTGLSLLKIRRLLRVQFAALDAVANALLLVFLATVHLIDTRMSGIDNTGARARGGS